MSLRKSIAVRCLVSLIVFLIFLASPLSADGVQTVANKKYDVWVSQSFVPAPFSPFHDCFTFTTNTLTVDACASSGPMTEVPIFGVLGMTLWIAGPIPCGGLNLHFSGTSLNGSGLPEGKDTLGAVGLGRTEGTTFGVEGIQNPSCSIATPTIQRPNPYKK